MKRFNILIGILLLSTNLWGSFSNNLDMDTKTIKTATIPLMPVEAVPVHMEDLNLTNFLEAPLYFSDDIQADGLKYTRLGMVYKPGLECDDYDHGVKPEVSIIHYYTHHDADIRVHNNLIMYIRGDIIKNDVSDVGYFFFFPTIFFQPDHAEEAEILMPKAFEELNNLFSGYNNDLEGGCLDVFSQIIDSEPLETLEELPF